MCGVLRRWDDEDGLMVGRGVVGVGDVVVVVCLG